jgi:hypothetical protein
MELIYARWLGWCTRISLAVLAATFLAYVLELSDPLVSVEQLPGLWSLALDQFLAASGAPTGWAWLGAATGGDYANLIGIAMLGMVSVLCYLRILPLLFARGEPALGVLAALQIAVLLAAASGLLAGGH